jgi:hypothetical protein
MHSLSLVDPRAASRPPKSGQNPVPLADDRSEPRAVAPRAYAGCCGDRAVSRSGRSDLRSDRPFAWKEERTLSQALTLQYDKVIFILEPSEQAKAAIGKRVTVVDYPDGRLAIRYHGIELAYRTFDKIQQVDQGAIVENKRLGAALAFIREEQLRRGPERRSGPRRRDQHDPRLFKVG